MVFIASRLLKGKQNYKPNHKVLKSCTDTNESEISIGVDTHGKASSQALKNGRKAKEHLKDQCYS